jgi:hypothetical protein
MSRWFLIPRPLRRQPGAACAPVPASCLLRLQVDAASANTLRRVVMRAGADAVRYLRLDPRAHDGNVQAVLCIASDAVPAMLEEVRRFLPGCTCSTEQAEHHAAPA